jgi:aspartate/methionine/tyrosine aminotransferase
MRDFALEVYFSKWEFKARYHMTASDIESMTIAELLEMAPDKNLSSFSQQWLGYTQTFGNPALREEIAGTYETASASDILCFAGAEEGVYIAMRVLLGKNDHAIVVVPNYQAAETIPMDICAVSGVALNADDNWSLDIDMIRRAIRPNTRLISINFPNNPTGAVLEKNRFDELVSLCSHHGIYLFSDEVYRLVERAPSIRLPQVADVYERGLSLNVMSKAYGLPGLRIGWIMTKDRDVLQKMERYKHYLSICNSAPSEYLATVALQVRDKILERNRAIVNSNAEKLGRFFAQFPEHFDWQRPDGGCVGYPLYKGPEGADQFCETLVEATGILLLPPQIYTSELLATPQDRFRIGFGRLNIDKGLEVFHRYLSEK